MERETTCIACGGPNGFGHVCRSMISIPKAEHERLLRLAEFWEALTVPEWDDFADGVASRTMRYALRAAIEKQEG